MLQAAAQKRFKNDGETTDTESMQNPILHRRGQGNRPKPSYRTCWRQVCNGFAGLFYPPRDKSKKHANFRCKIKFRRLSSTMLGLLWNLFLYEPLPTASPLWAMKRICFRITTQLDIETNFRSCGVSVRARFHRNSHHKRPRTRLVQTRP